MSRLAYEFDMLLTLNEIDLRATMLYGHPVATYDLYIKSKLGFELTSNAPPQFCRTGASGASTAYRPSRHHKPSRDKAAWYQMDQCSTRPSLWSELGSPPTKCTRF